jgi:hypothetical protein
METPLLSVLILTTGWRQEKFRSLMSVLLPQAEKHGTEIIALYNHGEYRVQLMRQRLLEDATGDYVAFVDDDDMVSSSYVSAICSELIDQAVDSVGFRVALPAHQQMSVCSRVRAPRGREVRDGILYEPWGIMTPTRRSVISQCRFDTHVGRVGEDGWLSQQVVPLLGPEAYIDEVLYSYQWSAADSSQTRWARGDRPPRPEIASSVFRWHAWSAS